MWAALTLRGSSAIMVPQQVQMQLLLYGQLSLASCEASNSLSQLLGISFLDEQQLCASTVAGARSKPRAKMSIDTRRFTIMQKYDFKACNAIARKTEKSH